MWPARALMRLCADYVASTTDFARQQNEHLTIIMMAQDFQDLSGQVIKKVTDILLRAEAELRHVVEELPAAGVAEESAADDGHQLEGVQVPDRAMQQEDVDDLLASLGF
jgi:chemotaxis protein CheZ